MGYRIIYLTHGHPQKITAIWTIFYPFETQLWIAIVLCTFIVCIILVLINRHKYQDETPSFRITAIAVLAIISESFPPKWLHRRITPHVKLVLFIWLPMSFLLGCLYKSSLLQFLMAGELEDPSDTFEKVLERDLIISMPTGTVVDQLFGNSPFETMRLAYEHGVKKGGYYPWGKETPKDALTAVVEGRAVDLQTIDTHIGNRHRAQISKKERPVGYILTGIMFKRNSPLLTKMLPILMALMDSGIYNKLKNQFLWRKAKPERDHARLAQDNDLVVLTWDHVAWTFLLVMCTGLALACFVFIGEVQIYSRNDQPSNKADNIFPLQVYTNLNHKEFLRGHDENPSPDMVF